MHNEGRLEAVLVAWNVSQVIAGGIDTHHVSKCWKLVAFAERSKSDEAALKGLSLVRDITARGAGC
jgi:hypothetical protein